jgi:hypothetical protein
MKPTSYWEHISPEPNSGCWLWVGATSRGYAIRVDRNRPGTKKVHRQVYEDLVGRVPEGLDLDHLCRVRCCVNPAHLEPVTRSENVRRGAGPSLNSSKTHCPKGHPYEEANVYRYRGRRYCRQCHREKALARYYRS